MLRGHVPCLHARSYVCQHNIKAGAQAHCSRYTLRVIRPAACRWYISQTKHIGGCIYVTLADALHGVDQEMKGDVVAIICATNPPLPS